MSIDRGYLKWQQKKKYEIEYEYFGFHRPHLAQISQRNSVLIINVMHVMPGDLCTQHLLLSIECDIAYYTIANHFIFYCRFFKSYFIFLVCVLSVSKSKRTANGTCRMRMNQSEPITLCIPFGRTSGRRRCRTTHEYFKKKIITVAWSLHERGVVANWRLFN